MIYGKVKTMYSLYAAKGCAEVPQGVRYSYYNPTYDQTLIYAEEKQYEGYDEMRALPMLSEEEQKWLRTCKEKEDRAAFAENKEEITGIFAQLLDNFDRELKKEIRRKEKKNGTKESDADKAV